MKSQLFITTNVLNLKRFEESVSSLVSLNLSKLSVKKKSAWSSGIFICKVTGKVFTISSVMRVHIFRFPVNTPDRLLVDYIAKAIAILKKDIPKDYILLDSLSEAISILR